MFENALDIISQNALRIVIVLAALFIGFKVINFISYVIKNNYRDKIANDAIYFLFQIGEVLLKVAIVISAISFLGVPTTSFIAIIGSIGLAIGLSLQGSLSNFAGGFLILMLKPFKSGDYITGAGHSGTVQEIQIFYTRLLTPDNKLIIIPNGQLSNDSIINFSAKPTRRLDLQFGVGYTQDIEKVKAVIQDVIDQHPLIEKDPAPFIRLGEWAGSSINFTIRVWVKQEDYWATHFDLMEMIKKEFDTHQIEIPFPKMDVYIKDSQS